MLLALPLAMVEAFFVEGWGALRFWDLSPGRQLFTTGVPWWFATLLVARLLINSNKHAKWYSVRFFVALTNVVLVVIFVSAGIASHEKLGYFPSHDHFRFVVNNLLRLNLHVLQTAPLLLTGYLLLTFTISFIVLFVLKKIEINGRCAVYVSRVALAFMLLGLAHWLASVLEGTWPKSSWAALFPRLTLSKKAEISGNPFAHWVERTTRRFPGMLPENKFPVIVVLVESLRADLLTKHPNVVPFLRNVAREGLVFDKAYAPASHSNYSDLSVWYSRYPLLSGARTVWRADDPRRGLSAFGAFKALGYSTAYVSSQNEKWGNMIAWLKVPEVDFFFHSEDFVGEPWEN
ncbi:MAG: sulfatase-like hydrolase/transferase [Thermoanaerobaculum sp.]